MQQRIKFNELSTNIVLQGQIILLRGLIQNHALSQQALYNNVALLVCRLYD